MGGNIFSNSYSINKENIEPTLSQLKKELSKLFPTKKESFNKFEPLGSGGKKEISNDIDLSYDVSNLFFNQDKFDFKNWNISEVDFLELYKKIKSRARTATDHQCKIRAIIELISDYIENNSTTIKSSKKASVNHTLFFSFPQFNQSNEELGIDVQIDINIGSQDWLRFSYYSEVYKGNVKGLHRTQLILSMFTNKNKIFKHTFGVIDKETRKIEATTPSEAINLLNRLYNIKLDFDITKNYFKLIDYLYEHLKKEEMNKIFDIYLSILDSTRTDIPYNLQEYWIENRERLNLKGNFLPDNSNLQ